MSAPDPAALRAAMARLSHARAAMDARGAPMQARETDMGVLADALRWACEYIAAEPVEGDDTATARALRAALDGAE